MKSFLTAALPNRHCSRRYRRVVDGAIMVVPSGIWSLWSPRLSSLSELASHYENFLLRPLLGKFAHDFVVLILLTV